MTNSTEPSWVAEGHDAAVRSGSVHAPTIEFVRIERLTATVIVLADGRRFRRAGHRKQLVKYDAGVQVMDPKDTSVVQAYARQLLRALAREASSTTYGSEATVATLNAEQVRAELDRIADLVNSSRRELDRRAGI